MTPTQLKKLLEKGGFSQRYAAKLLGIDERTMRYYIAGDREIPKLVELALRCLVEHGATYATLIGVKEQADEDHLKKRRERK